MKSSIEAREVELDRRPLGGEVDAGPGRARHFLQRLLDPADARRAGHALDSNVAEPSTDAGTVGVAGPGGGAGRAAVPGPFDRGDERVRRRPRLVEIDRGTLGGEIPAHP